MINSIVLENFQKHEKLEVAFTSGLNVIVGATDSGKSAIFRALEMVLFNGSKKSNVVKWGEKATTVTVGFDQCKVKRVKGSKNEYYLDEERFVAFGTKVPKEISDAVNLGEINKQAQHDRPFLLGESSPAVARYLNRLVSLEAIDSILSSISQKSLSARREIKIREVDIDKIASKKKALSFLHEEVSREFSLIDSQLTALSSLSADCDLLKEKIDGFPLIEIEEKLALITAGEKVVAMSEKKLSRQEEISCLKKFISELSVDRADPTEDFLILKNLEEESEDLNRALCSIRDSLENYEKNSQKISKETEIEIKRGEAGLRLVSPLCPTCNGEW